MGSGGSRIDQHSNFTNVTKSFLTPIKFDATFYYGLIIIVSVLALIGNICVLHSVLLIRKYKTLQKTCMVSLALSDILTVVIFGLNYLGFLSQKYNLIWKWGEFMCWYSPVFQVLGNLASSLALLVIALDRYHNVIYALNQKWNPSLRNCIFGAFLLWALCFGISYSMSTFYFHFQVRTPEGDLVYICSGAATTRNYITFYYVFVTLLFFLPLIVMFFWFYYKIALLIWKHRKPVGNRIGETRIDEISSYTNTNNNNRTDSTNNKTSPTITRSCCVKKKKNLQVERKIRTFKIVIILIFAFIFCRMPFWLFWLVKLLTPFRSSESVYRLTFLFVALNLLNCALNTILYTYLNQTILFCRKFQQFICTTCCCCFSNAEFEDYERGAPIYEGIMGKIKIEPPKREQQQQQREENINVYHENNFPQVPQFPKYTSINRF